MHDKRCLQGKQRLFAALRGARLVCRHDAELPYRMRY